MDDTGRNKFVPDVRVILWRLLLRFLATHRWWERKVAWASCPFIHSMCVHEMPACERDSIEGS